MKLFIDFDSKLLVINETVYIPCGGGFKAIRASGNSYSIFTPEMKSLGNPIYFDKQPYQFSFRNSKFDQNLIFYFPETVLTTIPLDKMVALINNILEGSNLYLLSEICWFAYDTLHYSLSPIFNYWENLNNSMSWFNGGVQGDTPIYYDGIFYSLNQNNIVTGSFSGTWNSGNSESFSVFPGLYGGLHLKGIEYFLNTTVQTQNLGFSGLTKSYNIF